MLLWAVSEALQGFLLALETFINEELSSEQKSTQEANGESLTVFSAAFGMPPCESACASSILRCTTQIDSSKALRPMEISFARSRVRMKQLLKASDGKSNRTKQGAYLRVLCATSLFLSCIPLWIGWVRERPFRRQPATPTGETRKQLPCCKANLKT